MNSFAFHVIKTLLQIVEAFQEPYYSHDTSLISIMYAKPDTFDSEDNVACSFLNLQIMHVLQYSRCLHSIKHLTKPALVCLGMSVLTDCGVRTGLATLESRGRWLRCVARVRTVSWAMKEEWELPDRENVGAEAVGRTHWLCKG